MKTSKSATKNAAEKKPVVKTRKKRTRQTGVRGRVLSLLASGAMSSSELVAKGGFSAASLYLNLKVLKKEGMVSTRRNGRTVLISLKHGATVDAPIEGEVLSAPKSSRKTSSALVSAYVPRDLHEALEGLARRLSPVDRAQEKLLVLDQLARTMPASVASVLRELMNDVVRLSTDHAG